MLMCCYDAYRQRVDKLTGSVVKRRSIHYLELNVTMSGEQLPRREREKLRQRQEIIAAALDLFSEKGFHSVSMHEIAQKSEFAIGTLYKFFENKDELYRALVLQQCDEFDGALSQALEDKQDVVEKLRSFIRIKGERFRGNLPFIRLFLTESWGPGQSAKSGVCEEVRERHVNFLQRLARVFETGIREQRFKPLIAAYDMAVALDSAINGFLILELGPHPFPYTPDPDAILDIFLKGLLTCDTDAKAN